MNQENDLVDSLRLGKDIKSMEKLLKERCESEGHKLSAKRVGSCDATGWEISCECGECRCQWWEEKWPFITRCLKEQGSRIASLEKQVEVMQRALADVLFDRANHYSMTGSERTGFIALCNETKRVFDRKFPGEVTCQECLTRMKDLAAEVEEFERARRANIRCPII